MAGPLKLGDLDLGDWFEYDCRGLYNKPMPCMVLPGKSVDKDNQVGKVRYCVYGPDKVFTETGGPDVEVTKVTRKRRDSMSFEMPEGTVEQWDADEALIMFHVYMRDSKRLGILTGNIVSEPGCTKGVVDRLCDARAEALDNAQKSCEQYMKESTQ